MTSQGTEQAAQGDSFKCQFLQGSCFGVECIVKYTTVYSCLIVRLLEELQN